MYSTFSEETPEKHRVYTFYTAVHLDLSKEDVAKK